MPSGTCNRTFPNCRLRQDASGKNRHVVHVVVDNNNAVSMTCRPSERLDFLTTERHRQRAKTRHWSRTGLQFRWNSSIGRALDL